MPDTPPLATCRGARHTRAMSKRDPFRPVDDDARRLARSLMRDARFAAIGVLEEAGPTVTRIAFGTTPEGAPLSLISELSSHTRALQRDPRCSLLVGEPKDKGDPLTHPRMTLMARAQFVSRETEDHTTLRAHYLRQNPKAQLYIDFADFHLVLFVVVSAMLNGGFGKAYKLMPADLKIS